MRKCLAAGIAALSFLSLGAAASADKLSGNYLVTLTDAKANTVNFCFTFSNTGQFAGYSNSGYWVTPVEDVAGNFFVDHGSLIFYGSYYNVDTYVSGNARLRTGKGGWIEFSYPALPSSGGSLTIEQGC
jgi:hypothetical protein